MDEDFDYEPYDSEAHYWFTIMDVAQLMMDKDPLVVFKDIMDKVYEYKDAERFLRDPRSFGPDADQE